jgi:hypothetical protein
LLEALHGELTDTFFYLGLPALSTWRYRARPSRINYGSVESATTMAVIFTCVTAAITTYLLAAAISPVVGGSNVAPRFIAEVG